MVDERMMHLFSLIAEQVSDKQELFDNEGKIMAALVDCGCLLHEADAALTLMQHLVQKETDDMFLRSETGRTKGMRAMNRQERIRFTTEAFGFVSRLSLLGIISGDRREEILEKAMDMYPERIELSQIKTLVAFTLFSGEDLRGNPLLARDVAWN